MIRCYPLDGSPAFNVSPDTYCYLVLNDNPPSWMFANVERRIRDGHAVLTIGGHTGCTAIRKMVGDEAPLPSCPEVSYHFIDTGGDRLPACRIESWRERAERLEREMSHAVEWLRLVSTTASSLGNAGGEKALLFAADQLEREFILRRGKTQP